jgi:hypothetical protein
MKNYCYLLQGQIVQLNVVLSYCKVIICFIGNTRSKRIIILLQGHFKIKHDDVRALCQGCCSLFVVNSP